MIVSDFSSQRKALSQDRVLMAANIENRISENSRIRAARQMALMRDVSFKVEGTDRGF